MGMDACFVSCLLPADEGAYTGDGQTMRGGSKKVLKSVCLQIWP